MPSTLPPDTGKDFEMAPEGTYLAVCYRIIDLGTQQVDWQGTVKYQRKVLVTWELPEAQMSDGRPFSISQRYTWSSHEKSRLRKDLESWRGKKFEDKDFGPGGFSIKNILGKGCLLGIVHTTNNGKDYANITAVLSPPKGQSQPAPVNPIAFLDLDAFNQRVYDGLTDNLKATIAKSPEYQEVVTGAPPLNGDGGPLDDSVPF